ncbi:MAG TPA: hypothetical protein VL282_12175, partial [Tepidisphaeraceae bacterium]|nr:hypothetical protein [Tepidisphaeraceae bacterium]
QTALGAETRRIPPRQQTPGELILAFVRGWKRAAHVVCFSSRHMRDAPAKKYSEETFAVTG